MAISDILSQEWNNERLGDIQDALQALLNQMVTDINGVKAKKVADINLSTEGTDLTVTVTFSDETEATATVDIQDALNAADIAVDIVNNLRADIPTKALSASMGMELNRKACVLLEHMHLAADTMLTDSDLELNEQRLFFVPTLNRIYAFDCHAIGSGLVNREVTRDVYPPRFGVVFIDKETSTCWRWDGTNMVLAVHPPYFMIADSTSGTIENYNPSVITGDLYPRLVWFSALSKLVYLYMDGNTRRYVAFDPDKNRVYVRLGSSPKVVQWSGSAWVDVIDISSKANAADVAATYATKSEVEDATPTIDPTTKNWVVGGTVTDNPSRGEKGDDGNDAPIPYIGTNGNWWVDGEDTDVPAQGPAGDINISEGETPTLTIVKNLNTEDDAQDNIKVLSAGMGKRLGDAVFDNAVIDMDVDHAPSQGAYIDNDIWKTNSSYYGKLIDVSSYHGKRFKLGNYLSPTSGNYYYRFALLQSRPTAGHAVVYSATSPYNALVTRQGAGTPQWEEDIIPNDVNYIYLYTHSSVDMTPQLLVIDPNPSSRIERLEELTDGVDDIKEGWFAVSGENYDYQVPANDCWVKQTVGDNGTTYSGSDATTMRAFPKSSFKSNAAASPLDCYNVDDLPNRVLTIKMASLENGYWSFRLVYYTSALGFISRTSAILVKDTDNWQKIINDIPSNAAYFKILMSKNVNGTLDADTYTLNDGDLTFVKRSISQESIPDRVAALESAVANAAKDTIRVLSYNIGHFAMGNSSSSTISDQIPDGDTAYPHSNYDVQLARWKSRIQNVCADVMLFCEYSTVFGTKNGAQVATAACGILDGYPHIAYGTTTTSAYFVNALISKFPFIGSAEKVDLGSLISTKAFMEVGTIAINGVYVKIASCHLTPNSEGNENTRLSRLAEINNIIKYFANDDHVIIGGDFNTTGPMITPRDWALGAEEFNPFLYGFDEEGTHYEGGYTLANHGNWGNLPTYTSTGEKSPGVPTSFIDNIIVKGFRMSGVLVIDDGNLSDHCGIMCDLTLID